jgi:hypothetical protein
MSEGKRFFGIFEFAVFGNAGACLQAIPKVNDIV